MVTSWEAAGKEVRRHGKVLGRHGYFIRSSWEGGGKAWEAAGKEVGRHGKELGRHGYFMGSSWEGGGKA